MLSEAKTAFDALRIADAAEAYRYAIKLAGGSEEAQRKASELKLRAERLAGELLRDMPKAPSGREAVALKSEGRTSNPTYAEQGIDKRVAARCQMVASIPEEKFEEFIAIAEEISNAAVLRIAREVNRFAEAETPNLPDERYRVLYADPPWKYGNAQHTTEEQDTVLSNHYPPMDDDKLLSLPVKEIAKDEAVLFLWATSPRIRFAFELADAWGFEYKALFVWDKIKHNVGYYNSVRHEFLLICTRGSCLPDVKELYDSVVSIERTEHSVKPAYFREIIDKMYPNGKRIELFRRGGRVGLWDAWGDEAK
jgi:N6-adenosine-specific RNA methylase IME4